MEKENLKNRIDELTDKREGLEDEMQQRLYSNLIQCISELRLMDETKSCLEDAINGFSSDGAYQVSCMFDPDKEKDDLIDKARDFVCEHEVIYYSNAIGYLSSNDPSLRESLMLASEFGFKVEDLSSETLATLHLQDQISEELNGVDDDILDVFNEVNDWFIENIDAIDEEIKELEEDLDDESEVGI